MNSVRRRVALLGIAGLACLLVFLGYWLSFAMWMTAYHSSPGPLRAWQFRFYVLLAAIVAVCSVITWLGLIVVRDWNSPKR